MMVILMEIIGIIAEYNPFHTGHKYHITKIKEMYPDSLLIVIFPTSFTERGEVCILNKWDKTNIALDNNIDLVVELPFVYGSQSADQFAKGALKILNILKVKKIVFGSESNDIKALEKIAKIQLDNQEFNKEVKNFLNLGFNYPTSLSKALNKLNLKPINNPNDLLGISYLKEIIKNNYAITPVTIKRTNKYHGNNQNTKYLSASELRSKLSNKESIQDYLPYDEKILYKNINLFPFLKYKIITDFNNLNNYQTVDEGIENRLKNSLDNSSSIEDFITKVKCKRYTYNKINRMLIHILVSLTKEEAKKNIDYIRILGFNGKGKKYLNQIKKNTNLKIITNYKSITSPLLDIEYRALKVYSLLVNDPKLIKDELKKPIQR